MENLDWDAVLATGIQDIDDQHRQLVAIAQGLIEGLRNGVGQPQLKDVVARLRHYSVAHFAAETRVMHELHFPELEAHVEQHRKLSALARTFQDDFYRQRVVAPEDVRRFMRGWLFEHILKWDMRLAEHIKGVRDGTIKPAPAETRPAKAQEPAQPQPQPPEPARA